MFHPQHVVKDGKAPKKSISKNIPEGLRAQPRPRMNADVEGILKEELVGVFKEDRTKLLTAEQQKVIWKREEKARDSERRLATALHKQNEVEETKKREALEELYANVTKQKIEARKEQIKAKKQADAEAKIKRQQKAREAQVATLLDKVEKEPEGVKRQSHFHHDDLLGEVEETEERKPSFGPKKYSNKFGPPVYPNTELPGEYGDAEWDDAEDYGYSSKFPYPKKNKIVHSGKDSLPPYVAPESASSDEPGIFPEGRITAKSDERSGESGEVVSVGGKLTTDNLIGLELGLHHVDKAATSLAQLLSKIMSEHPHPTRVPTNSAVKEFAYNYSGESEMSVGVETDVKAAVTSPPHVKPLMIDQYTQVWAKDILEATGFQEKSALMELEMKSEKAFSTRAEIQLERKASKRRDAMTLTRPAGYKELELSMPVDALTFEAQTQVKAYEIDQDYALTKGVFLTKDNILWPTVGDFDIETAAKRIQDYMDQCWSMDSKWMDHIQPIQTISDDYRKRYVFEVKFSVPTPLNPIPLATASVFFIFEISHYAPRDDFVKVHYIVEGTRFLHTPGTLPFQDKWLWSVISDKVRVQRSIDF